MEQPPALPRRFACFAPWTWRWRVPCAALAVAIGLISGCNPPPPPKQTEGQRLEDLARATLELITSSLENAESVDIFALSSERIGQLLQPQGSNYLGHFQVLESLTLDEIQQRAVSQALKTDVVDSWNKYGVAECFYPSHGLRIQTPDKVILLVISFSCHQIMTLDSEGDQIGYYVGISHSLAPKLNSILGKRADWPRLQDEVERVPHPEMDCPRTIPQDFRP